MRGRQHSTPVTSVLCCAVLVSGRVSLALTLPGRGCVALLHLQPPSLRLSTRLSSFSPLCRRAGHLPQSLDEVGPLYLHWVRWESRKAVQQRIDLRIAEHGIVKQIKVTEASRRRG